MLRRPQIKWDKGRKMMMMMTGIQVHLFKCLKTEQLLGKRAWIQTMSDSGQAVILNFIIRDFILAVMLYRFLTN